MSGGCGRLMHEILPSAADNRPVHPCLKQRLEYPEYLSLILGERHRGAPARQWSKR